MRKIPSIYDSPIDNIILVFVEQTEIIFRYLNMTPNMLTLISTISYIIATYLWYYSYNMYFLIFYLTGYYFDCLDGYYARKYNMVTEFGDYFDHYKDILVILVYISYTLKKLSSMGIVYLLPYVTMVILNLIHVSATEKYLALTNNNSSSLSFLQLSSLNEKNAIEETLKNYRFFGCGTSVFVTGIIIVLL